MYKSYKFRAYPNDKQKQITNQTFGNTRFVYNYYLSKQQQDNNITIKECISDYNKLKQTYQFLSKENQYLMISTIYKLNNNIKKYKSNGLGYPKYKSKYNKNSYTLKENIIVNLKKQILISPNLGELKIRGYKKLDKINGTLINITISKEKNDKYYISLLYDIPTPKRTIPRVTVGIDLGVRKLLTLSDGTTYNNIHTQEKYEKRIPIAKENFARAGAEQRITLLEGDATDILKQLEGSYDLIFMDAAKGQYIHFLPDILRLLPTGGLLVSDNVLQDGDIIESRFAVTRRNRTIHARMRDYLYELKHHPQLETVILPVGDGVTLSTKV